MSSKKAIFWRVYLAFFMMLVLSLAIAFKIFTIQRVEGAEWRAKAHSLTTKLVNVEAKRGNIYASNGSLLATSLYKYDIKMDLWASGLSEDTFIKQVDTLSKALANLFTGPYEKSAAEWATTLKMARAEKNRYLLIHQDVSHTDLKQLKTFPIFRRGQFGGGLIVEPRNERFHPYGNLAKRTLGYRRHADSTYVVGLEGHYNHLIGGKPGKILKLKVSSNDWIPIEDANTIDPEEGSDLYTTIDVNIQDITESALLRGLLKHKAAFGCAIVMEVATGKIRAIANLKGNKNRDIYGETYNYAVGRRSQPGSTFKLASLLMLLEHGHMMPTDTIWTEGGIWQHHDRQMRDGMDLGSPTMREAFEKSSNIFFGKAMEKQFGTKPEDFVQFLERMHVVEPTGIPIEGEREAYVKDPFNKNVASDEDRWYGTTLAWMAHGYELELTPIQTLCLFNTVANRGVPMKPMLVTAVKDLTETQQSFSPVAWSDAVLSPQTVGFATTLLQRVVDHGTAKKYVKSNRLSIAGKTGTALKRLDDGTKEYQASFAGFFPANNPKYSCIVVIHDPTEQGIHGASAAGPIFKEIAEGIHSLDIHIDKPLYANKQADLQSRPTFGRAPVQHLMAIYETLGLPVRAFQGNSLWAEPAQTDQSISLVAKKDADLSIPDVYGMSLSDALYLCENIGLQVVYQGNGTVYRQVPEKGTPFQRGKTLYINLK